MIKKISPPALFTAVAGFLFFACTPAGFDEETLLRYARASTVYAEGRFAEAAWMLAGINAFPPALVLKGKAEYFSGDLGGAEKSLRRALALRPGGAEASLYLARIFREQGEIKEAEALVEAVLGDDPSDIRALRLAAELSREEGPAGAPHAAAFLDRAAEASAETALVFLDRARIRWIAGDGAGALEDLGKTRMLLPRNTPLVKSVEALESVIREVMP
ncbi:MAG: tetratricopeptide repeat protein [Treponema sp.]|jgi:tetratricopeptide (TPR) repeat protein|nr:tetratricopeptide repeat protein [Treponema sp.]